MCLFDKRWFARYLPVKKAPPSVPPLERWKNRKCPNNEPLDFLAFSKNAFKLGSTETTGNANGFLQDHTHLHTFLRFPSAGDTFGVRPISRMKDPTDPTIPRKGAGRYTHMSDQASTRALGEPIGRSARPLAQPPSP